MSLDEEAVTINKAWMRLSEHVYKPEIDNGIKGLSTYLNMNRIASYWQPKYSFADTVAEIKRRMEA